jgi:iron complex outermembrane receptor protein
VGVRRGQLNRIINVTGVEGRGAAFINNQEQTNTQLTNTLNYNKQLSSKFNLNAVAGHEWLTFDSKSNGMNAQDFANVGLDYYDIMQYSTQTSRNIYSFANPTTELQSFLPGQLLIITIDFW